MAMGDEYPEAEVIGTDIAKIQPSAVPLNVFFEIDDAEEEGGWTWPNDEFDLVHLRHMAGAFADWPQVYSEAYGVSSPVGGSRFLISMIMTRPCYASSMRAQQSGLIYGLSMSVLRRLGNQEEVRILNRSSLPRQDSSMSKLPRR